MDKNIVLLLGQLQLAVKNGNNEFLLPRIRAHRKDRVVDLEVGIFYR